MAKLKPVISLCLFLLFLSAPIAVLSKTSEASKPNNDSDSAPFIHGHYVLGPTIKVNGYHPNEPTVVIVDKGSHLTHVLQWQGDEIARVLTIPNSTGKGATPSPPGRYHISEKDMNPVWEPPKSIKLPWNPDHKPVPPYNQTHKNPLGVARISLDKFNVALHGTNQPKLLKKSVSHGCIRHNNSDIVKLYGMVDRGTVVYVVEHWRGHTISQKDFKTNIASGK